MLKYPCDSVEQSPGPAIAPSSKAGRGAWVLIAAILGSSMAFIDGTVVNVALPSIQHSLNSTVSGAQWVVESYALFLAALILLGGALGDLYGRRLVFTTGVFLFAAASAWCGLAPDMRHLVMARALQGVGGALLVPGSLAIISAAFPAAERGKAIGTWSGFTGITAAIGPIIGGWLIEHYSWRWVFFLNLPLAAAVIAICFLFVPESRGEGGKHKLDIPGALLITLGLGCLVFGMIEAPSLGWTNPETWGTVAGGLAAIGLFLWREARVDSPLLPLSLFRSMNFTGANLLTLLLYAALGALLFFLPYNLIQVQGYTPTQAGAANLPLILILFFLSRWAGGLVAHYGAKLPLVIGPIVAAAGFLLFARPGIGGSFWTTYFPAMIVLALGMSGVVAPLTTTVMDSVSEHQAGVASGVNNAVSRVASLLSIAVLGIIAFHVFDLQLKKRLDAANLPQPAKHAIMEQRSRLTQIEAPPALNTDQKQGLKKSIDESFLASFRWVMIVSAGLALLSAVSALVMIAGKPQKAT
ncbi:MAG TPA: MFS transporter [Candidatus Angelobacter sp.]|nr:MFS transporter [Candidatus Angelobacter sp.]